MWEQPSLPMCIVVYVLIIIGSDVVVIFVIAVAVALSEERMERVSGDTLRVAKYLYLSALVATWFFLPAIIGPEFNKEKFASEHLVLGLQLEETYKLEKWTPGDNPISNSEDVHFYVEDLCDPDVQVMPLLVSGEGRQQLVTVPVTMIYSKDAQESTISFDSWNYESLGRYFTFTPEESRLVWSWGSLRVVRQNIGAVVQQKPDRVISTGDLLQSLSPTITIVTPFCEVD